MATDFLDELARLDVPAPPAEFDNQLHQRVNQSLVVQHVADLVLGAVPWAALHFVGAALGAFAFTMTGRYPEHRKGRPPDNPRTSS